MDIPNSYFDYLEACTTRFPNKVALEVLTDGVQDRYTYLQLYRMAVAVGSGLSAIGVRPGDRVGLLDENHPDWGIAFLGIWAAGGVAVPLDFHLTDREVENLLSFAECRHLFVSPKRLDAIRGLSANRSGELQIIVMSDDCSDGNLPTVAELRSSEPLPQVPIRSGYNDTAAILFTSGTSADPKGVVLSHHNILTHNAGLLQCLEVDEKDCILGVLPLHHALALNANFLIPLSVGAKVTYLSAVTSQKILAGIKQGQATIFVCIPQFYYLLHRHILQQVQSKSAPVRWSFILLKGISAWLRDRLGLHVGRYLFPKIHSAFGRQLRLLACGGSYLDPKVIRDLSAFGFQLVQAYGLTETTAALSLTPLSDNVLGSVGKALPETEIKIVDADRDGTGEIIARGPTLMQGYYKRPDLTGHAIRGGWLQTGDLGHIDKTGSLFVTGRKKDVIVLGSGKNIYPDELEQHFLECPSIKEVCVLGIESFEDENRSEKLHLIAVPDFDYLRQHGIVNAGESLRFDIETLSNRLPSHKRITSMEVRSDPLPRTTTQKVRRVQLKEEIERRRSQRAPGKPGASREASRGSGEPLRGPHSKLAEEVIRRHKNLPFPLQANHNLELDLGFDSLERLELISALEQRLNTEIPEELAPRIYSVQDLLEALGKAKPHRAAESKSSLFDQSDWSHLLAPNAADAPYTKSFLKPKPVRLLIAYGVVKTFYYLSRGLFHLKTSGVENLPREAPFLICPNHLSYADGFFLVACLPYRVFRRLFFVGFSEYFTGGILGFLGKWANVIPIDPDSNLIQALRLGAEGLRHKKILCIFPEGSRSIDGRLKEFHRGTSILAAEFQAPIVPVGLAGTYEVWPRDSLRIHLHPVSVRFGTHIEPIERTPGGEPYPYEMVTRRLREAVAALIGEEKHLETEPEPSQ